MFPVTLVEGANGISGLNAHKSYMGSEKILKPNEFLELTINL